MLQKFGDPSSISISDDQLKRLVSFREYNVFFEFKEKEVIAFGIFNKEFGDMKFKKEYKEFKPVKRVRRAK